MDLFFLAVRLIGWVSVIILPGSIVTFGLPLREYTPLTRLAIGIVLSPFVIFIEFYLATLAGLDFELSAVVMVLINLPAVLLIYRQRRNFALPKRKTFAVALLALAIPIVLLLPQLLSETARCFTGHAWFQSDVIYMLRNGGLTLEDPELAGIPLSYPWAAHVFQGVLSFLLDSPPASSYVWTNVIWICSFFVLTAYTVKSLGGRTLACVTAPLWLFLGVNVVGFAVGSLFPISLAGHAWSGGDYRYTPWMLKFYFFEQSIFGLGLFSALAYVTVSKVIAGSDSRILKAFLLTGIGIIYPIFFPPAVILLAGPVIVDSFTRRKKGGPVWTRDAVSTAIILLVSTLISFIYLRSLTSSRITSSLIFPAPTVEFLVSALLKAANCAVVTGILVLPFLWYVYRSSGVARYSATLLGFCAAASLALNVTLEIPYYANEYKFIFPAAICLAPFPALYFDALERRLGRLLVPVVIVCVILLSAPMVIKLKADFPWTVVSYPEVDTTTFDLRLASADRQPIFDRIRLATRTDTIIVADRSDLHLPTLTQRTLFAPPAQDFPHPGAGGIDSYTMLTGVKGYSPILVAERRAQIDRLFYGPSKDRQGALSAFLSYGRPVGIILRLPEHETLRVWLSENSGMSLFDDGNSAFWLICPNSITSACLPPEKTSGLF